jgi:parallel beta-helix repeat protein
MKSFKMLILIPALVLSLMACNGGDEGAQQPAPPDTDQAPIDTEAPSTAPGTKITTSGRMMSDEIWRGELMITGDVEIPPGVTLTIEPGTVIRFTAQQDDQHSPEEYSPDDPESLHTTMISIIVLGTIEARGTPDDPITFTSERDVPGEMDWQSILIEGGTVILDNVVIEHSYFGLQLNTPSSKVTVRNSLFRNVTTCCICTGNHPFEEAIIISDNHFNGCGREAIDTYWPHTFEVSHNLFSENHVGVVSVGSSVKIKNNLFINNGRGVGVYEQGTPEIIENEFTENDGAAIHITNASPIITNNNIYGNFFSIQIEEFKIDVDAENNWWGSTEISEIEESIQDGKDEPSLGFIDYEPFAIEPFVLDIPNYQ